MSSEELKLDVWKGDWGLPTIDLTSLEFLTYIKFSGINVQVNKRSNPFRSPKGSLPVLYYENNNITTYEDLVKYLKTKNWKPDEDLSVKQQGELKAYANLLNEKLAPTLLYLWWIDEKNHTKLTRPWYCKVIPFPFNFYYPSKYQRDAERTIEGIFDTYIDSPEIETRLYSDAEKCLTALSNRLGTLDYMFGNKPTSLDATIYAYLAPLLYAPFPIKTLQNHLTNCQNLRKFVHRISQLFYSKDSKEYEDKKREEVKKNAELNSEEFPNAKRNKILAGFVAVFSMLLYAVSTGIIKGPDAIEGYDDRYDDGADSEDNS